MLIDLVHAPIEICIGNKCFGFHASPYFDPNNGINYVVQSRNFATQTNSVSDFIRWRTINNRNKSKRYELRYQVEIICLKLYAHINGRVNNK